MPDINKELENLIKNVPNEKYGEVKSYLSSIQKVPKENIIHYHLDPDIDYLPIQEDKTNRSKVIPVLAKLIIDSKCPYTFSINGNWGSGKTIFISG